ncbi:MAG: metal ABC transporter substrate-binding protein [Acidimicrobiia bacterium]|nr:metal ABC transporter substrate-binding protein [Acidimicrobiia bacterium]
MILKIAKRLGIGPALVLALIVGACSGTTTPTQRPLVVVSTTIWGDVVSSVMGNSGTVEVLMPIGADPHDFRPSAKQVALLDDADLVIVNGLGLEEGLADVIDSLSPARVLTLGPLLDPIAVGDSFDPHVWLDPQRAILAVDLVAERLGELDGNGQDWQERADGYKAELRNAMVQLEELAGQVQPERRVFVTQHDSLRYFAAAYGYEVVGTLIEGGSTLSQPSPQHLADITVLIEKRLVPAIFFDAGGSISLATSVAQGAGVSAVVGLYIGSLGGPGSGAETYIDMMLVNGTRIAAGLAPMEIR